MRAVLTAAVLVASTTIAAATEQAIEVQLNERGQEYANSGKIVLRDVARNRVLGQYQFITGGLRRGSAPLGAYKIGTFFGTDRDPRRIGPRWVLVQDGMPEEGMAYDPRYPNAPRTELLIHAGAPIGTEGCIGILGGPDIWREFMANINLLLTQGAELAFTLAGNPRGRIGSAYVMPLPVYYGRARQQQSNNKYKRKRRR